MKISLEKYTSEYEQHYHIDNNITNVYMHVSWCNSFKNILYRDIDSENDISTNTYWKT